jgi:hypothetical protein
VRIRSHIYTAAHICLATDIVTLIRLAIRFKVDKINPETKGDIAAHCFESLAMTALLAWDRRKRIPATSTAPEWSTVKPEVMQLFALMTRHIELLKGAWDGRPKTGKHAKLFMIRPYMCWCTRILRMARQDETSVPLDLIEAIVSAHKTGFRFPNEDLDKLVIMYYTRRREAPEPAKDPDTPAAPVVKVTGVEGDDVAHQGEQ